MEGAGLWAAHAAATRPAARARQALCTRFMGVSQTSDGLDGSGRGEWRASRRRQKLARSKLSIGAFEFLRARQSRQLVTDTTWTQHPPIGWLQACVNLSCYSASGIGARMPALMRFQALI